MLTAAHRSFRVYRFALYPCCSLFGDIVSKILCLEGFAAFEGKEPVKEHRLFKWGINDTTQGAITLTQTDAPKIMQKYEKRHGARGGKIDIDYFHLSRKQTSGIDDRVSAGTCRLELREDGIWAVDIEPTERALEYLTKNEIRSYSPVVDVDSRGRLISIEQLSLTNIPAMDDAGLLAAEDVLDDALQLSVTPFKKYPIFEGSTWDAKAADQRLREFLSSDGTDDLSKVDMTRYRRAFVFYDGDAPEATSKYKGQILDVQDVGNGPELVVAKKAVQTLGAALQGSRGGISLSDSDREKGKALLTRYYKLFDAVAPWDRIQPGEAPVQEDKMLQMTPVAAMLMLQAGWANETREMLAKEIGYRFGEHAYIDDWSADKVRVCKYSEGPGPATYYEMTYTVDGSRVTFGEPVEVVRGPYIPKTQATAEVAMQDKLNTAHTRLLEVTGVGSTSEALVKLEALQRDASKKVELEAKLIALEDREYAREREVLINDAKRAGKWTLALEQQGDRAADMARRLSESRVKALETHWGAAPVVIAPGGERQPEVKTLTLSDEELEAARRVAQMQGKPVEQVCKSMLEAKKNRA